MENINEYSVIYSDKMGMGYILPDFIDINKFIKPVEALIGSETIEPNTNTTLLGYFNLSPAKYIGMIENEMIFYLGNTSDLFQINHYYISLLRLSKTRIFSMFTHKAGRDFNLVNDIWK